MEEKTELKRRRWLFWVLFIPLTIATIWLWTDIIVTCNRSNEMQKEYEKNKKQQQQIIPPSNAV